MSNYAAKLIEAQVEELLASNEEVFIDKNSGDFYTYEDIAEKYYTTSQYTVEEITTGINAGTYPIKPNRRMFPRL